MVDYILLGFILVALVAIFIVLLSINKKLYLCKQAVFIIEERVHDCYHKLDYIDKGQDKIIDLLK